MARACIPALLAVLLALLAACGDDNPQRSYPSGVVIETVTPVTGGGGLKAASAPPGFATPVATSPASTGASSAPVTLEAPTSGRWIDVDVSRYEVRLMEGEQVLQLIGPVAVGAQIDTGAYESTQTGLYHVYNKIPGLQYDAPYDAYLSDWVAFDPDKANGFHSFLQDASGAVVDPSTGRVSNGCIRTGASAEIYAFAEIGMPVRVHF